jgi:hypothetical protein
MVGLIILFIWFPAESSNGAYAYSSIQHAYLVPMYLALAASLYSGFNYYRGSFKEIMHG